jgi:hypothetical protein
MRRVIEKFQQLKIEIETVRGEAMNARGVERLIKIVLRVTQQLIIIKRHSN